MSFGLLPARDLDAVLRVLEDCERAAPGEFRRTALDAIARHLGYRHTTFFVGGTLRQTFADRTPEAHGFAAKLVGQYVEARWDSDIFSQPESLTLLRSRWVTSLDELPRTRRPKVENYIEKFMLNNGVRAKTVIRLNTPGEFTSLIGLISPNSGDFGYREYALGALLGKHLGNLLALHDARPRPPAPLRGLSPRQAEVVALVAEGRGNEQIARTLSISVGTVKKHLTAALSITGCANRTQLAIAWRGEPMAGR